MLRIIGTSHIARESIDQVDRVIKETLPDIVAVELDRKRLYGLLNKDKQRTDWRSIRRIGLQGWLFAIIGSWIEKKLGAEVGVAPGDEMLKAISSAKETGAKIALIDQDIEITLRRFSKNFTWKEKKSLAAEIINGLFKRKKPEFDLQKVPKRKIISELIEEVRKKYPSVYKVLILERNEHMAKELAALIEQNPEKSIVAVVGAGHEQELPALVKKYINQ